MKLDLSSSKELAKWLRALSASHRAQADAIDAYAASLPSSPELADPLLDRRQRRQAYPGIGSAIESAIADGSLPAIRGSRQRALVRRSDVEAWLSSRSIQPRPPRSAAAEPISDLESWDRQVLGGAR